MVDVAVKYCGGCNCSYDRVAMVGELREQFPAVNFRNAEGGDESDPDLVLVICGCPSVCAAHSHLDAKHGKIFTASAKDFAAVREKLEEIASGTM
ncbi:MAG: hypothetical protein LIQ30_10200 [Planctomycetes bacterium]|nr:hypothetical protein [Planctomycetota bacterium]MCD7897241.1 hypothetical protein [Planctomycetaceae bacterium]